MKFENRNSKFDADPKFEIRSRTRASMPGTSSFGFSDSALFRISISGFRISFIIRHLKFVIRTCLFLSALCLAVAVIGCASEKKHKWMTFFFDGVPQTGSVTNGPVVEYDEN